MIISGSFMSLATMRQTIELEKRRPIFMRKKDPSSLKFQTASENFYAGYGHFVTAEFYFYVAL